MICNKKNLSLLVLSASLLSGAQQVSAYSSMATKITSYCSDNNYDLLPAYQSDSCGACHSDSSAKSAYNSGDYDFFCPAPVEQICTDADADGYFVEGDVCGTAADFADNDATAYPGAPEICDDGVDNDGDGLVDADDTDAVDCPVVCTDMDGDGYSIEGGSCGAIDCDDNDADTNPGAVEVCTDGVDNNCNGLTDSADDSAMNCPVECTDLDGDGYSIEGGSCGAVDCNDSNADVNPGAAEICSDKVDNNCNGLTDTADQNAENCPVDCTDSDGDGYSIEGGSCGAVDCDDNNAEINPGALEVCDDASDNNCNGLVDSADSVCQSNEDDDQDDEQPWWRKRHHRHHEKERHHSHDRRSDCDEENDRNVEEDDSDEYHERDRHRSSRFFRYFD